MAGGSSVAGNNVYDVVVQASDGSLVDTQAIAVTVTDVNAAPVITSNSGGVSASVNVAENSTAVTTVVATDDGENNNTLTYSIVGGADIAKFTIDPNTGVLSFVNAPDFENPTDVAGGSSVAGNNVYDVIVRASDGTASDDQAIAVTVTNVAEGIAPVAGDDVWILSDTAVPAGTITLEWVLNNDTDVDGPALYVSSVANLPPWLTANFIGGQLVGFSVAAGAVAGNYTFTYTLTDGSLTDTGSVSITVLDTTNSGTDSFTLDGNDYSYVDLLGGTDTISGDVILTGNAGQDIFLGNNGSDTLNGGGGNDRLFGNESGDILNGGAGADFLDGGNGNDTLTGGAGNDFFVLSSINAPNIDTITDYAAGDLINISQVLSVAAGTNVITGGYLRVTTTGLIQVDANGGGNSWDTVGNVNIGAGPYAIQYLSGGVAVTVNVTAVAPPIALDLDGDGQISFLATDAGATFDYGGGKVATAWVGPQDGILVRDANHDGQISAEEIVFATSGSDLQGLAVYDSNGDGQLSAADSAFAEFGVWQDADSDGQVDAGELQSLTAEGIASISLSSDGVGYSAAGGDVSVVGTGSFTRTDGSTGVLADAVFATGGRVAEAELRTAAVSANTNVIAAAVAAMGFAATSAAAHESGEQGSLGQQSGPESQPSSSVIANHVENGSAGPVQLEAMAGGKSQAAASAASHSTTFAAVDANHSLTGSEANGSVELTPLAAGTEAQGGDAAGPAIAPAMVVMPSAEALIAAFDDAGAAKAAAGETAASVVAEALADGSQGSAIDAILAATLPSSAGNGQGDAAQTAFAGHGGLAVAEWHGSGFGLGMGNALSVEHIALHPDMQAQA